MFKSKWRKKYERATEKIKIAIQVKECLIKEHPDAYDLNNLLRAEIHALERALENMEYIAES